LLATEVREVRKKHKACISAQDNVDIPELLRKIVREEFFKVDYNQITDTLLFKKLPYSEAITVIQKILDDGCFKI